MKSAGMLPRRVAMGAVGAAALAAGLWLARRGAAPEVETLWNLRFDTPAGGELALAAFKGRPLLLNFWATWCAPCVREMPQIERFHREFGRSGWQVVGIAIDGPSPVREFLAKTPVSYPIALAGFGGAELARALGNANGGLPFTVAVDAQGRVLRRRLGETHFDELRGWTTSAS